MSFSEDFKGVAIFFYAKHCIWDRNFGAFVVATLYGARTHLLVRGKEAVASLLSIINLLICGQSCLFTRVLSSTLLIISLNKTLPSKSCTNCPSEF